MVERVPRSGRELLPPQAVDERVDVDHPALPEREHRQQRLSLRAAHVRGRPARENLERAEQPDLEQLLHTRLASTGESRTLERAGEAPRPGDAGIHGSAVGTRLASRGRTLALDPQRRSLR